MNLPTSSLVWSQYRLAGGVPSFKDYDGWIKGWVFDANTFITCSHAIPSIAGESPYSHGWIYVESKTKREWRKITKVTRIGDTDISICKVDAPFPKWAKPLTIADKIPSKLIVFHQDRTTDTKEVLSTDYNIVRLVWEKGEDLVAGDSGLPWVFQKNKIWYVASHAHKGLWGEGPSYPYFASQIKQLAI